MKLNDIKCKNAKPAEKPWKLSDGAGMYLEVMPNGSKYWRLKYRINGKEKRLALGVYPEVSLADARDRREKARKQLQDGLDPSHAKQDEKRLAKINAGNLAPLPALLINTVNRVLETIPRAPFLCLPLSATLYAVLKDEHGIESSLVAGDLSFKNTIIFQSDFPISGTNNESLRRWAGHAWVELDGSIIDLSLFRTIYSDSFTKPCKNEMVSMFGEGRGAIIASPQTLQNQGLLYTSVETLTDDDATGIIKGIPQLSQAGFPLAGH